MKHLTLIAAALAFGLAMAPAMAASPKVYKTEAGAQKHCPSDTVVWANTDSGVFHEKGTRWYGKTKDGRYVCKAEAVGAGWHPAGNGQ